MSGFVEAPLGTKISPNKIQKVSGYKLGDVFRITILSKTVAIVKYHYSNIVKSNFYCFEGICCEKFGLPSVRYIFPVIVYDTDKSGDIRKGSSEWRLAPLVLGYKDYQNILLKEKICGDITGVDLICTCTNEQYQSYSFDIVGATGWRKMPEITDRIKEDMAYYKANLKKSFAREITAEELINILSSATYTPSYFPPNPNKPDIPDSDDSSVFHKPEIEPPVEKRDESVELDGLTGSFDDLFK